MRFSRNKPGERFLFVCLLVALSVGVFALKVWVMTVELRLADNLVIRQDSLGDDKGRTNMLTMHERRLREIEHIAWAVWDHHAPCDGWPTQQQIAKRE